MNFKEYTWPGVELRFCSWLLEFKCWIGADLSSSVCLHCFYLVMANKCEGAFFWSIAFNNLCCDTLTRMRLQRGARPKVSLWSQDLILIHLHKMTKNSAIERVHKHPELSVVKDKAPAKLCRDFEQVDWSCHLLLEKNCKTGILECYRWKNRKSAGNLRNYINQMRHIYVSSCSVPVRVPVLLAMKYYGVKVLSQHPPTRLDPNGDRRFRVE